jgi:hypothetical protein
VIVGGGVKEIQVRGFGGWTSYTCMKLNKKPLTMASSGVGGVEGRDNGVM